MKKCERKLREFFSISRWGGLLLIELLFVTKKDASAEQFYVSSNAFSMVSNSLSLVYKKVEKLECWDKEFLR